MDHEITEEMTRDARDALRTALRPWREKYPQVDVAESIRLANPSIVLVQAAEDAALLVVGRAHRHGPAPHLGPVAQAAIHHGRCPVAVVPHD
ncbi:universal stress protein [Streptomyces sp. NPDC046859]|uniref:universal stress protein n=1 Tax=Streptomyces sp. NPDC046859 TaxID=3155734 RepID=UPI0033DF8E0D